jgi:hypothetical protein
MSGRERTMQPKDNQRTVPRHKNWRTADRPKEVLIIHRKRKEAAAQSPRRKRAKDHLL